MLVHKEINYNTVKGRVWLIDSFNIFVSSSDDCCASLSDWLKVLFDRNSNYTLVADVFDCFGVYSMMHIGWSIFVNQ